MGIGACSGVSLSIPLELREDLAHPRAVGVDESTWEAPRVVLCLCDETVTTVIDRVEMLPQLRCAVLALVPGGAMLVLDDLAEFGKVDDGRQAVVHIGRQFATTRTWRLLQPRVVQVARSNVVLFPKLFSPVVAVVPCPLVALRLKDTRVRCALLQLVK